MNKNIKNPIKIIVETELKSMPLVIVW